MPNMSTNLVNTADTFDSDLMSIIAMVMDSVSDGVFVLKPASNDDFIVINSNRTVVGLLQKKMNGRLISQVLPAGVWQKFKPLLRLVGGKSQCRSLRTEFDVGGNTHQVKLRLEPLCRNGKVQAMVVVVKLLTKTVKMQQENRELRNRFAASFEYAPYGVCFIDSSHKPAMVNRSLARTIDKPIAQLQGNSFASLIHLEDRAMFEHALEKVFEGERVYDGIEIRIVNSAGNIIWVAMSMSLAHYGRDDMRYAIIQTLDITNRKANETELMRLATQDHLTGANNRLVFDRRLRDAINNAQRYCRKGAVLFIDMDDFKMVNDTFGHKAGDAVLKAVVNSLSGILRSTDILARIGGDEFAAILEEADEEMAERKADEVRSAIAALKVPVKDNLLDVRASIGVQVFDGSDADLKAESILNAADQAMYAQKNAVKEQHMVL